MFIFKFCLKFPLARQQVALLKLLSEYEPSNQCFYPNKCKSVLFFSLTYANQWNYGCGTFSSLGTKDFIPKNAQILVIKLHKTLHNDLIMVNMAVNTLSGVFLLILQKWSNCVLSIHSEIYNFSSSSIRKEIHAVLFIDQ